MELVQQMDPLLGGKRANALKLVSIPITGMAPDQPLLVHRNRLIGPALLYHTHLPTAKRRPDESGG
jgi:hypothetical protein